MKKYILMSENRTNSFVKQLQFLKKVGYRKVTGRMYPNMRHEILNETGKEEVYANIAAYLSKQVF